MTSTLPLGFVLSYGSHHSSEGCKLCLLEACLIPGELLRSADLRAVLRKHKVTDHPEDVCPVRTAFGRALNDAYGDGAAADAERTADLAPLELALRGTAARGDSQSVALVLWDRSLRDWYPRSLEASIALMRASCVGLEKKYPDVIAACEKAAGAAEQIVAKMRAIPK